MIGIVTGASSGLGIEYAKVLDQEGLRELWLIARNKEAMEKLADELDTDCRIIICDLSSSREIDDKIRPLLEEEAPNVKFCVNNAGFGKIGPFDELICDDMINMVDLNCKAVVHLSHLVIPYMQRGSILIHTSSAASFAPLGGFAVYGATKSFVTSFSVALRSELMDKGIHSTAVCPGPIETNFSKRAHEGSTRTDSVLKKKVNPRPVIEKALRDAKRNKPLSIYGAKFNFMYYLSRVLPQSFMAKVSFNKISKTEKR